MQPSAGNNPPDSGQQKSRLDREIEEILAQNDNIRHLPSPPKPKRQPARPVRLEQPGVTIPPRLQKLVQTPIVQALVLGFLAYLVRDFSPLLANVFALGAVVCIILPMVQRLRPSGSSDPESRMWRGQVIEMRPQRHRSPLDNLRSWWESRRR